MQTITIEPAVHNGDRRIKLMFGYDEQLINLVKKIPGRVWSRMIKCWHIPDEPATLDCLLKMFKGIVWLNY